MIRDGKARMWGHIQALPHSRIVPSLSFPTSSAQVVSGVQAPSMGRRVAAPTPAAEGGEGGSSVPSAAAIAASSQSEPCAVDAKLLTETRALNRWGSGGEGGESWGAQRGTGFS